MTSYMGAMPPVTCPSCHDVQDGWAGLDTTQPGPVEDDFVICFGCGAVNVMGPGRVLRPATDAETVEVLARDVVARAVTTMMDPDRKG